MVKQKRLRGDWIPAVGIESIPPDLGRGCAPILDCTLAGDALLKFDYQAINEWHAVLLKSEKGRTQTPVPCAYWILYSPENGFGVTLGFDPKMTLIT